MIIVYKYIFLQNLSKHKNINFEFFKKGLHGARAPKRCTPLVLLTIILFYQKKIIHHRGKPLTAKIHILTSARYIFLNSVMFKWLTKIAGLDPICAKEKVYE